MMKVKELGRKRLWRVYEEEGYVGGTGNTTL